MTSDRALGIRFETRSQDRQLIKLPTVDSVYGAQQDARCLRTSWDKVSGNLHSELCQCDYDPSSIYYSILSRIQSQADRWLGFSNWGRRDNGAVVE